MENRMRARSGRFCLAIVLVGAAAKLLQADQIQIGTANSVTVKPFGDDTVAAYEQSYSSSSFSTLKGSVSVSELDFLIDTSILTIDPTDPTLQPYPAQYQVTLSEIDPASNLDINANILGDLGASPIVNSTATLSLTTDPLTGTVSGTLALVLNTPFQLDPSQDLLLDVQQVGAMPWTLFALQADSTLNSAAIDSISCTAGCNLGLGLVTDFIETPQSPATVPEPSAALLVGSVIGLMAIVRRRRKTGAVAPPMPINHLPPIGIANEGIRPALRLESKKFR
jgi:hypothetical protein